MSEECIDGICPCCKDKTSFRELTFTENISDIGSYFGGLLTGGKIGALKQAGTFAKEYTDSRSFPNYKCDLCGKQVMQCSECEEILVYADFCSDHICGKGSDNVKNTAPDSAGDIISLLERLASLKEKGILTDEEFLVQKSKILES